MMSPNLKSTFFFISNRCLGSNTNIFRTEYSASLRIYFGTFLDLVFGSKNGATDQRSTSDIGQDNRTKEDIDNKGSRSTCDDSPEIRILPKILETGETHDGAHYHGYIPMYQSEGRFRVSVSWPSQCDRTWVTLDSHPEVVCTFDRKGPEFEFRRRSFKIQENVTESGFYVDVSNPYEIEGSTIDFVLEDSGEVLKTISVRN